MADLDDLAGAATVEQAKGVLAQQLGLTPGAAGDQLQDWASNSSQPLAEVASRIIAAASSRMD